MKTTWTALALCLAGCGAAGSATSSEPEDLGDTRVGVFARVARYDICVSTQPAVDHYREVGGDRALLVYHHDEDGRLVVARYRPTALAIESVQGCRERHAIETNATPVAVQFARDEAHARALAAEMGRR